MHDRLYLLKLEVENFVERLIDELLILVVLLRNSNLKNLDCLALSEQLDLFSKILFLPSTIIQSSFLKNSLGALLTLFI